MICQATFHVKNLSSAAEDYAKSSFTAVKSPNIAWVYRVSALLLLCLEQNPSGRPLCHLSLEHNVMTLHLDAFLSWGSTTLYKWLFAGKCPDITCQIGVGHFESLIDVPYYKLPGSKLSNHFHCSLSVLSDKSVVLIQHAAETRNNLWRLSLTLEYFILILCIKYFIFHLT